MPAPTIEFDTHVPAFRLNGWSIETAPLIDEVLARLGPPSRVDTGPTPAPYGHRNNQLHVYDELGLRANEHHFTRRCQEIAISFHVEEPPYRFTPRQPFQGTLLINGVAMPLGGPCQDFIAAAAIPLKEALPGLWDFRLPPRALLQARGFSMGIDARGEKLPSGRRSQNRRVIDISFGLPHDEWKA